MNNKPSVILKNFKLVLATLEDYPVLQNMGRFYVYDMSEFFTYDSDWNMPEDGLYECIDFKKYFQTENTWPFLVRYNNELAGFVIVDKKGSEPIIDFNMAQFFILRKFKGKGVGKYIAHLCFRQFKGIWEVMVMPENIGAYHFWGKTVQEFSSGNYQEYTRTVKHLNNSKKNVFRFYS